MEPTGRPDLRSEAGPPSAAGGLANLLRALRYRNYRLYFLGQGTSLIGTWLTRVATAWLVYRLTGSAFALGLVSFAGQVPVLLFAPFAGVIVDRCSRYRILLVTQVLSMLQSAALAALTLPRIITVGQVRPSSIPPPSRSSRPPAEIHLFRCSPHAAYHRQHLRSPMKIDFPYPDYSAIAPFEVPDANLMGIYAPKAVDDVDEKEILKDGFAHPHNAPRLRAAVHTGQRVLILIDDATRATPTARILPHVFDELHAAGVKDPDIEFLEAPGTHRPMQPDEIAEKLGTFDGRYKVHEHHYLDRSQLHNFGTTRDGTPVTANRLLTQFDFILGIGSIVPHRVKGTSGGAKIMFPGVSGPEMMDRNQWEASMHMSETVMGVSENPMRLRMEEAAKIAGLKYIVNVVYDIHRKIVGCFCGDIVQAHREGSKRSRMVYAARMPTRADIVVIDSHSQDRDFWQSAKGPYAGTMAVRDGGSMIAVAPNPEGMASNHPILMKIGYRPSAELVAMVQRGEVDDLVGIAILHDVTQIVDKTDCIMVSPGVKKQEAEKIGFRYARSVREALNMAFAKQGRSARVAVLRYGGHILPIVDDEASQRIAEDVR